MADEQPTQDDADVRDCMQCGGIMEAHTQPTSFGGFGSTGMAVTSTETYYVCPDCGHDTRSPNG